MLKNYFLENKSSKILAEGALSLTIVESIALMDL